MCILSQIEILQRAYEARTAIFPLSHVFIDPNHVPSRYVRPRPVHGAQSFRPELPRTFTTLCLNVRVLTVPDSNLLSLSGVLYTVFLT